MADWNSDWNSADGGWGPDPSAADPRSASTSLTLPKFTDAVVAELSQAIGEGRFATAQDLLTRFLHRLYKRGSPEFVTKQLVSRMYETVIRLDGQEIGRGEGDSKFNSRLVASERALGAFSSVLRDDLANYLRLRRTCIRQVQKCGNTPGEIKQIEDVIMETSNKAGADRTAVTLVLQFCRMAMKIEAMFKQIEVPMSSPKWTLDCESVVYGSGPSKDVAALNALKFLCPNLAAIARKRSSMFDTPVDCSVAVDIKPVVGPDGNIVQAIPPTSMIIDKPASATPVETSHSDIGDEVDERPTIPGVFASVRLDFDGVALVEFIFDNNGNSMRVTCKLTKEAPILKTINEIGAIVEQDKFSEEYDSRARALAPSIARISVVSASKQRAIDHTLKRLSPMLFRLRHINSTHDREFTPTDSDVRRPINPQVRPLW